MSRYTTDAAGVLKTPQGKPLVTLADIESALNLLLSCYETSEGRVLELEKQRDALRDENERLIIAKDALEERLKPTAGAVASVSALTVVNDQSRVFLRHVDGGGDIEVCMKHGDTTFAYATVHYNYIYNDNANRGALAREIAGFLEERDTPGIRRDAFNALKAEVARLEKKNRLLAVATPPPITGERLADAMQLVWDDHCADADSIPSFIKVHGPASTRISANFNGDSFADRVAEVLAVKIPVSGAIADIAAELERRKSAAGWTGEHDDELANGELARAAGVYALLAGTPVEAISNRELIESLWPFESASLKYDSPRQTLVEACAFAAVEIERIDRAAALVTA